MQTGCKFPNLQRAYQEQNGCEGRPFRAEGISPYEEATRSSDCQELVTQRLVHSLIEEDVNVLQPDLKKRGVVLSIGLSSEIMHIFLDITLTTNAVGHAWLSRRTRHTKG